MSCFPCFSSENSNSIRINDLPVIQAAARPALPPLPADKQNSSNGEGGIQEVDVKNIAAKTFTFRELASATKNFRQECLLGEGASGKVYKATLQCSGQVVAVKRLDRNGMQGSKEFLVEVFMLSLLKHNNLLGLIGYCADGDQRLLVYNYMPLRSLDTHLFDNSQDKELLDWATRIQIASGAAQGLEYLHEKANPPIIYRDMKASNILLEDDFKPRLCDFGLAKYAQSANQCCTPPRVMNTYGYCAPEYTRTGQLSLKSDVYSFGVVLLELITGRRAMDPNRPFAEQNLVTWAQPIFRDPKRFPEMVDPLLDGEYPIKSLNQAIGIAAMCLEEEPSVRPYITDVVAALSFLEMTCKDESTIPKLPAPIPSDDQCNKDQNIQLLSDHLTEYNLIDHHEENDQNDSEHETDIDKRSYSSSDRDEDDHDHDLNDDADDGDDEKEEEEEEDQNDDDESEEKEEEDDHDHDHNDSDQEEEEEEEYDNVISDKKYKNSLKWRGNAESSDDESMYSSSTRSSISSSNKEEQRL